MYAVRNMVIFSVARIIILLFILSGIAVGVFFFVRAMIRRKRRTAQADIATAGSLGERIRENRIRCSMTQEFVAEQLGVSRQAVSKWENGTSEPSTGNLLALAKLFGVSVEELLRNIS